MKKALWFVGLPFSIVGLLAHLVCYPFAAIAKLLGHNYWKLNEEARNK